MTHKEFARLKVGQEVRIIADAEPDYIGCVGLITMMDLFSFDDRVWLDIRNPQNTARTMGAWYSPDQIELLEVRPKFEPLPLPG